MKCLSNITKKNNNTNLTRAKEQQKLTSKSNPSLQKDNAAVQDYAYMIAKGMLSFIG